MKKIALTLGFLLFAAGAVFAQSDLQVLTVVKLNKSESITVRQLKARCDIYEKQIGRKLSLDEKKEVLNALVDEKLVLQAAAKSQISVTDNMVDQYFLQSMSQQVGTNVTERELNDLLVRQNGKTLDETLLAQVGMNVSDYKAYLKNQLILRQYVISQKQDEIQKVAPTHEQIQLSYESNKRNFTWDDMAKLLMVVVPKKSDPDAAKNKLSDLRNKFVDKKLSVEQLTVQSKIDGSGYVAEEGVVPKTEAAAAGLGMPYQNLIVLFNQDEGFVSDVQETSEDFRFVSIRKKYAAKMLSISDIIQPETTVTVYDYIRANLTQQMQLQYVQQAAQEISTSLHKPEYIEEKRTGDALNKLLSWGD